MAGSTESMEMGKSMEVTNMCTALERLKAEGIEQGMEKGVEKTVISMLKKNYPISEICEITEKTEEEELLTFLWNIITSLLPIRSMSCPFTGM